MKPTILIVDDDEEIRSQLHWALTEDYDVYEADDRPSARTAFTQNKPLVTLLDLGLPPQPAEPDEGFAALNDLLGLDRTAKIIMVTGQGERINALRTVGEGAFDFLSKPVDMDELKIILKRAVHVAQLEREYRQLQQAVASDAFEGMIGIGPRMQAVFSTIRKLGGTDAPVLILGESGTGKEVTALAIHRQSLRCNGPFIPINCGAIPENLLESELFGYEKGAFTGAHTQRKGRIESANGGTLFLDEIGELPVALQVKLLRFLQEQTIERIGGRTSHVVDTRIITATNADLKRRWPKTCSAKICITGLPLWFAIAPCADVRRTSRRWRDVSAKIRHGGQTAQPDLQPGHFAAVAATFLAGQRAGTGKPHQTRGRHGRRPLRHCGRSGTDLGSRGPSQAHFEGCARSG